MERRQAVGLVGAALGALLFAGLLQGLLVSSDSPGSDPPGSGLAVPRAPAGGPAPERRSGAVPPPLVPRGQPVSQDPPAPVPRPGGDAGAAPTPAASTAPPRPRLRVEDARGLELEARVSSLAGKLLTQGRSPLQVPGRPGDLVRVEAPGHVAEVLPLPAAEQLVRLASGRPLRGRVVAAESGLPLADARVEAHTALARTDADGRFELVVPAEGRPELRVIAPARPSVSWSGEEPAHIEVPAGVGARGRVQRADDRPPGRVELLLVGERQLGRSFRVQSEPDGRFELPSGLHPAEQVALFAWSPDGWATARAPRWQAASDLSGLLQAPATLRVEGPGRLDPAHAWPGEPPLTPAEQVGTAQRYTGLAPGLYRLSRGEQVAEQQLAPGAHATLRLSAPAPGRSVRLRVRALDADGAAVVDAEVRVRGRSGREAGARVDAGGVAEVTVSADDLQGPLTVSGSAPGRVALPRVVEGGGDVELVLARSVALEIALRPPAALDVAVFRDGVELARGQSDAQGRLRFAELPAGEARVVVETRQGLEVEQVVRLPLPGALVFDVSRRE